MMDAMPEAYEEEQGYLSLDLPKIISEFEKRGYKQGRFRYLVKKKELDPIFKKRDYCMHLWNTGVLTALTAGFAGAGMTLANSISPLNNAFKIGIPVAFSSYVFLKSLNLPAEENEEFYETVLEKRYPKTLESIFEEKPELRPKTTPPDY